MSLDRAAVLAAWADARWARLALRSRCDVERRQARLWRRMAAVVARTPAVARLAGRPLADFPIVEPGELRRDFARWNTLGLRREQAEAAAADSEAGGAGKVADGIVAGFSTGTAGARGVFVSGPAERARYIGQALGKLLPATALLRSWRIALVLRADNRLYRDVEGAGRFRFRFFGLDLAGADLAPALAAFDPHVLIAPAHVLADLARWSEGDPFLPRLERLFWGAEPMGPAERAWIADALGRRPDPIYQATEGFLGAPCAHGALHLNEDALVVELEPVEGVARFRPIVTDLYRTSQPMIRVRLDDLIEPLAGSCPCGSPLRAIAPIEGRASDVWRWPDRIACPREVEAAVETVVGPSPWQAEAFAAGVDLWLEPDLDPGAEAAAVAALQALSGRPVTVRRVTPPRDGPKRRRVRWRP